MAQALPALAVVVEAVAVRPDCPEPVTTKPHKQNPSPTPV